MDVVWPRRALRAALVVAGVVAGCAPAGNSPRLPGGLLHVVTSGDGTVTLLDGDRGQVLERALPAGPAPWQVAPGPAGSVLVLSMDAGHVGTLTQLLPPAGGQRAWTVRPVPVGARTRQALLAGGGEAYAAVAYSAGAPADPADTAPAPAPCGLDLIDGRAGRVVRRHAVCEAGREAGTGLALEDAPGGAVAYLGIAAEPGPPPAGARAGSRVLAVAAESGATLAVLPLAGPPAAVVLAPEPGSAGRRLYAVETAAGPDPESPAADPDRARLLALDPVTLAVEREYRLGFRPLQLAIGPEGDHGYALAADGHRLLHLDLHSGAQDLLADLPLRATGIAVTATAVYVAQPAADLVRAVPRRPVGGAQAAAIPVGRHPTGITRSGAG